MMRFDDWLRSFPWLHAKNQQCIVSADLDGVACSLLQSITLNWETVGVYDGRLLACYRPIREVKWHEVVFIDVEILRRSIHSIGNHLFAIDVEDVERLRAGFPNCANPNLWRKINVADNFQRKYPFSTLPLLLAAQAVRDPSFRLQRVWLALMLHTDSSFTNAAVYQDNALDWLAAMDTEGRSPGLDRMCRRLRRIPGQVMVSLLNEVQQWVGEAGFGKLQRACRFDPRNEQQRQRITALIERLNGELGTEVSLPLHSEPVYTVQFALEAHPNHTIGRRKKAFALALQHRVLSMAATGRTDKGLSITLPNADSPIELLR